MRNLHVGYEVIHFLHGMVPAEGALQHCSRSFLALLTMELVIPLSMSNWCRRGLGQVL